MVTDRWTTSVEFSDMVLKNLAAAENQRPIREIPKPTERKITGKWIGGMLRKRLHLSPQRTHGKDMLPATERPKLERLLEKYGVKEAITALD